MTAFAAIFNNKPLSNKQVEIFDKLAIRLSSQAGNFHNDCIRSSNLVALKLWLAHSRTQGFGKDEATGSWLACIGNPTDRLELIIRKDQNYAQSLLSNYLKFGREKITSLNAPFVVVIYDNRNKSLNVVTDRVGLQHIYLTKVGDSYVLSTSSLALACVMPVHLEKTSLVNYFLVGHLQEQKTFFEEIEKIDGAIWLTFVDGKFSKQQYWLPPMEQTSNIGIRDCAAELAHKMKAAVCNRLSQNGRTSIELTGGLDSRLNLACAVSSGRSFRAWTIAEPNCPELRITEYLKGKQSFPHDVLSPRDDIQERFLEDLQLINVLTDGETNSLNFIASPSANRQTAHLRDASISGVGGEILRGFYYVSHKGVANSSKSAKIDRLIALKLRPNVGGEPAIFSQGFPSDHNELLKASVESYFSQTTGSPLFWRLDHFYFKAREQRFAGRSCCFNNFFYRPEYPFFDNDIIDISFRLPWRFKRNSKIVRHTLHTCHHGYAEVPLISGSPARPFQISDLPLLVTYYAKFGCKIFRKVHSIIANRPATMKDDIGIRSLVTRMLCSQEITDLLNVDDMASGFLYDSHEFCRYITESRTRGFPNQVQIGLILSFELTCRHIGSSLQS